MALGDGNEIVMYEGYGFGSSKRRSKRRASGRQTAMRKKFGHCAKSCRSKAPKGYGGCMRTCLRRKAR